jgi:general secretion pathway protein G
MKKGFTLIELLIVIVIIGIIQTVVVVTYLNAQKSSRDTQRKTDLNKIASALEMWYSDKKYYPETDLWISTQNIDGKNETLASTLLQEGYIDVLPCDPKVSAWNCAHGGHNIGGDPDFGYIYVRKDYKVDGYTGLFPGKNKYGLYATLEAPSKDDKYNATKWDNYDKALANYFLSQNFDIKLQINN